MKEFKPDFSGLAGAIAAFNKSFTAFAKAAAEAVQAMFDAFAPFSKLERKRREEINRLGPRNENEAGEWLSDNCAGWVHDACRAEYCACSCH